MNIVLSKLKILFSNTRALLVISILLLLTQFGMQIYLARYDSQTTDEAVHLSAGYTYLVKHDFRFNPEHPLLVKYLVALPLLVMNPNIPDDDTYWNKADNFFYDSWRENRNYGEDLMYDLGNSAENLLFWGRVPIVILTFMLGLSLFFIVSKLYSSKAGLLAVVLYITNPIVNAHGHLITTDIVISLGFLLVIYSYWLFLQKQSWQRVIWLGLALGLAFAIKYTAVILLPVLLILGIYHIYINKYILKKSLDLIGKLVVSSVIAWLFVCVIYQFQLKPAPEIKTAQSQISSIALQNESGFDELVSNHTSAYSILRNFLIPRDYFKGMIMVIGHTQGGHDSFFMGQTSKYGWWYYFPVLFNVKNSIIFLVLIYIGIYLSLTKNRKNPASAFFTFSALIYLVFAMLSKADLGVRHILPMIILVIVPCGELIYIKYKYKNIVLAAACLLLILESILTFPHYLLYYNALVGGSKNGYKIACDSNLDWGQDIKSIKKYMDDHNISNPYVEYPWDGQKSLGYYDIMYKDTESLNPDNPDGYLIISATYMQSPKYTWLKSYTPYDRITDGVFVYKFK